MAFKKSDILAVLIIGCFVILAVQYARATPFFEAPDEGAHFLYVHNILEESALPKLPKNREEVIGDDDPTQVWSLERHQPPLYYLLGAALISPTERDDVQDYLIPNPLLFIRQLNPPNIWLHVPEDSVSGDTATAIWILRIFSLLLSALSLWFIYQTAKLAFPDEALIGLLTLGLVASIPNFIAVSTTVTNDTLVIFLYTMGIYWVVRLWQQETICKRDVIVLSMILAAIALTKLTGLTLFGIVYFSLLLGLYRQKFTQQQVVTLIVVSIGATVILAGWWYVRNYSLYDDPLATNANLTFWERDNSPASLAEFGDEAERVWRSFWFMLGHPRVVSDGDVEIPVEGPAFIYSYAGAITIVGVLGILLALWRKRDYRDLIMILSLVCGLLILALIWGTRQVEISYGRLLFPGLAAVGILVVLGWLMVLRDLGQLIAKFFSQRMSIEIGVGLLLIGVLVGLQIPLMVAATTGPTYLKDAFPQLEIVESLPSRAIEISGSADGLELLGYELEADIVEPTETVKLWLYIRGQHPDNPALFVNAFDPTQVELGGTDFYPGMSPTSRLDPDVVYRVPVEWQLNDVTNVMQTRRLDYYVGWQVPSTESYIQWETPKGGSDTLLLSGPTMINRGLPSPDVQYPINIVYGDSIGLRGVSFNTTEFNVGDELVMQLVWGFEGAMATDWDTVIRLMDREGNVTLELIDYPSAYPTSAWRDAPDFPDIRRLVVPENTPSGVYHIQVGWRNAEGDFLTYQANNEASIRYYEIPVSITIR